MNSQQDNSTRADVAPAPVVLEFDDVSINSFRNSWPVRDMTFRVGEGELMLVRLEDGREDLRLMTAALGLIDDLKGRVLFENLDWTECDGGRNEARRGRIGRVFLHGGWVTNITVEENVTLSQRYHTKRLSHQIRRDANECAKQMGLDPVPDSSPATVPDRQLRCYQWVRATYFGPRLLLLEQPMEDVEDRRLQYLVDAVIDLLKAGSAVVWLTTENRVWHHHSLQESQRFVMSGSQLQRETEAA